MNQRFFSTSWGKGTIARWQAACFILLLLSVACSLKAQSFVHPGLLHKQADFDRMKSKVNAGAQPWKAGWDVLTANSHASLTRAFTSPIPATIYRGFNGTNPENYASLFRDAASAYQTALRWKISGDDAYAEKSIAILNAWSAGMTTISGTADRFLLAGIQGYQLANAAEIMRSYSGWIPADFTRFQNWMLTVWYPINHDFLVNHNGACISNYYANWDLCNMASILSIGVLCDRRDIYNEAIEYFKNGAGTGSIRNVVPFVYGELGQWQESGRDQGHTVLGVALAGSFCEMAWSQGDDLYGYDDNRMLKGFEYIAKYNLGYEVPYTTYRNCIGVVQTIVSEDQRGNLRPVWEMVYNHYVNRKGLSAPYSARFAQLVRPEGGGGNFGPNSGGYDQLGFGTLTFSLDEPLKPSNQTITFPAIPNKDFGAADFSPGATASSGLPVVYASLNPTVASINADGTIHVSKPGTTTITAQQMGDNQYNLAPVVYRTLTVNQIPGVTDGTWSNATGITTTTIASIAGSADLNWPGQPFVVGDLVRLTGTVPGGFTTNTNYSVVAVNGATIQLSLRPGGPAVVATTTIANGTGNRFMKWSTATNWTNSVVPGGAQANATFGGTNFSNIGGVTLDGNITVGTLTYAANGTSELTLASGQNGGTLTFQTLSGMPAINMINTGARKLFMGNANNNSRVPLKIAGTQGLRITTPVYGGSGSYAGLRIQAAMDWSGLQGGINLVQGTIELHNTTNSLTDANNVLLPPTRLTMGTDATAVLVYNGANLYANKQTIGALDGTSDAYIMSRSNLTNGASILAVGVDNQDGTFDGTIGSGPTADAVDKGRVNLEKVGTGTQTITGSIKNGTTTIGGTPFYSSVTVNSGKLVLTGANEYQGATTVNSGTLVVNGSLASPVSVTGGTLAGAGRTSGSVTIGSGAFITPGISVGMFTTSAPLLLASGATYQLELTSSNNTMDKIVANGVSLEGASLMISDLGNAGSLPVGTSYVIIDNTSNTPVSGTFAGLAEGSILTVGSIRFQLTYQGGTGNDVALTVAKRTQTILFNSLAAKQVGDADVDPGATATSGLSVSYTSSNTAVATIVNGKVQMVGEGTSVITASQAGDANVEPATPVSQLLTVTTRINLTILHRDVDNYADNNAIQPLIHIQNQGGNALALSRLTLRYYVTVENAATLGNLVINYAQLGNQQVRLRYVPLTPAQLGAQGYVEYSFTEGAGNLAAGANSGPIQTYLAKSDYSSLYEPDDYSYAPVRDQLVSNLRITAYYDGVLVAGVEPGSTTQVRAVRALTESKNGPSATQINTYLEIRNEGNVPVNYSELKARYYFTSDGSERLLTEVDAGNVTTQLVKINPALANADTYLELSFNQGGQLVPGASTGAIRYRISKPDGGRFNQTNDHSYQEQPQDRSQNNRMVVYVSSERVWGQEPAPGARIAAKNTDNPLILTVLGNPVANDQAIVEIRGATGQPLKLTLTDIAGHALFEQQIESIIPGQQQVIPMSRQPGIYLLQAATNAERATIKLIKP
ncbi:cellulose binding domain-containing protein [Fibrella forsythiae]|uniref:Alginate lyase family protein n=1 Tax=Fibrella forsythiae TaxID=2817061 RepID=A0ABS3JNQ4_9BACT|nr:cellulose binding domain-containing protein [Fibrella forsythiae]MBO0950849.1 alginate lyase family protein [Fibrella forsythiae]